MIKHNDNLSEGYIGVEVLRDVALKAGYNILEFLFELIILKDGDLILIAKFTHEIDELVVAEWNTLRIESLDVFGDVFDCGLLINNDIHEVFVKSKEVFWKELLEDFL